MIAVNQRSMMKVVPIVTRKSEKGENTIVPKDVIQSPAIWIPMPIAKMPK